MAVDALWFAGAQLLFLIAVTPIMHDFWNASDKDSAAALMDQINAFKNIALAGALLFFLAMKRDAARLAVNEKLKAA
jgi:putative oxidoreductase